MWKICDKKHTYQWLRIAGPKVESEGINLDAQDKNLLIKNKWKNVMKNGEDPICLFTKDGIETVEHLISGRKVLTPIE